MNSTRASDALNYIRLDDRLTSSGQPTIEELEALAREGTEVVINLALHDAAYALPDEAGSAAALGMTYVHIPVQFDAPTESDLLAFFAAMDAHANKKVHVHCAANKRATVFLGLYRALVQRYGEDRAFTPMREIWEPNAVWDTFIRDMLPAQKTCHMDDGDLTSSASPT